MELLEQIIHAIVYGIIQGLGEFLPISSTAHLVLFPWILGWEDPGLTYDVALHMGTLLAVIMFFWKDWILLIKAGFTNVKSPEGKLFWFIMFACIPGGIFGLLFNDMAESKLRNPIIIGIVLIVMGLVLYAADKASKSIVELKDVGFARSMLIGFSQAIAIIPGVSRSGVTMTAGRLMGITRESAAKFTFLLSTPFIFLSGIYKLKDIKDVNVPPLPFTISILTSAVIGALSIKFLLQYLKNRGFGIFVVYRIILGVIIIVLALTRG